MNHHYTIIADGRTIRTQSTELAERMSKEGNRVTAVSNTNE